jgi:hypothetical protein
VQEIWLRDLDTDGDLDLLALFVGEHRGDLSGTAGGATYEGAAIVVIWNDDGELQIADAVEISPSTPQLLHDVVAMNRDTDPEPELVMLTENGGFQAELDPAARTYAQSEFPYLGGGRRGRLEVADFNGDGLDDLAVLEETDLYVMLAKENAPLGPDVVESTPGDETGDEQ